MSTKEVKFLENECGDPYFFLFSLLKHLLIDKFLKFGKNVGPRTHIFIKICENLQNDNLQKYCKILLKVYFVAKFTYKINKDLPADKTHL